MNRRYIALFVAFKDRTWASALFVSLSAVGMALGPLLSLPLSLFPTMRFAGLTFDHVRPSSRPSHACCLPCAARGCHAVGCGMDLHSAAFPEPAQWPQQGAMPARLPLDWPTRNWKIWR